MAGMGAFLATIKMMERENVVGHIWDYGRKLVALMQEKAEAHGVANSLKIGGFPCSPYYLTLDDQGVPSLSLRTLFAQEMVRQGVLMPWIALSWRHGEEELNLTGQALDIALPIYKKALADEPERYLEGPVIKPVFRKFN
jgi:glutamate-1-semialdehyde 2,1-aminomutase